MSYWPFLPRENLIGAQVSVSNFDSGIELRSHVLSDLRNSIANKIVVDKVKLEEAEYTTTYRIELYVLTPDELGRLIQQEALRMSSMMNMRTPLA